MELIYIIVLFFAFLTVESKNLKTSLISLTLNSLFISISVFLLGYFNNIPSLYLIGFLDIFVRAILIPVVLSKSLKNRISTEIKPSVSYPLSIALSIVILSVVYHFLEIYKSLYLPNVLQGLPCGITLFIYGFYLLLSKRDLFKMVISFIVIENGIHLFLISTIPFLSKFLEFVLTFNYIVAIFLFNYLLFRINEISFKEELQKIKEINRKENNA